MNKNWLVYVLSCCAIFLAAQVKPTLIWPLDSPRVLTGNFGELRPNHFHTGIDFSTNGKENLQVYAIEDGYVSRIKVSPVGYGKVVYVTHANSKVSVYAHLNAFSLKIDKALKEEQISKRNYEVDFYPVPWSIYVRKHEIIGLSGNTGGSSGPHLHFELRDEKTERTINPLTVYNLDDHIRPSLQQVAIYDLSDSISPVWLRALNKGAVHDTVLLAGSCFGLAFAAYDQYLKEGNRNNVYEARVYLDTSLLYHHRLNLMDFEDFRYVNEFSENRQGLKFQKCFLPSLYPAYLYPHLKNRGKLELTDQTAHHLKLVLSDEAGNTDEFSTFIKANAARQTAHPAPHHDAWLSCYHDTSIQIKHLYLNFPYKSLYRHLQLRTLIFSETNFQLLPAATNFRSPFYLGLKCPEVWKEKISKVVLKTASGVVLPTVSNDSLWYGVKTFGSFSLSTDELPPLVKTNLASRKKSVKKVHASIEFFLSDNLSGIGRYSLFVNDHWVIAEYDAKSGLLSYRFEDHSPLGRIQLRLEVSDRVGNRSEFHYTVQRD